MSISTSPYAGIGEIKEAGVVNEANDLLKRGFVLIKVIEKTNTDQSTSIVYVLGKTREGLQQLPAKKSTEKPQSSSGGWTSPLPAAAEQNALESLNWKGFNSGKGEWAFFTSVAGEFLPELKPAAALIEKMKSKEGTEVTVGTYTYKISKERFLNRFPAK